MEKSIATAHPDNVELIRAAYGEEFEMLGNFIDCMGYIGKEKMAELAEEDPDSEDDSWIMYLQGWDYECHFGVDKFRPASLRGKISRALNESQNIIITEVHISQIQVGDTIQHEGHLTTVCANNIKRGGFCGTSLFGDSYRSGSLSVKKVTFKKPI